MRNTSRAQSLLEFALIIPILILMVTIFLDLGRAVFSYAELQNAVREGARFAVVLPVSDADYEGKIKLRMQEFAPGLGLADDQITIVEPDPPDNMDVNVTATFFFQPVTPGLKQILGSSAGIPLSATSVTRIAPGAQQ